MKLRYATKRDRNGNRDYLIVDDDKRTYSTILTRWFNREDFIEIGKKDYKKLRNMYCNSMEYKVIQQDY